MKIAVFYSNDAGSSVSAEQIRAAIEGSGHELVHLVERSEGLDRIFERRADLIVAAGGDGTVASLARALVGRETPMAVLPLGTANNIAASIGSQGPIDVLVNHWGRTAPVRTDLGVATGPWGDCHFAEGVGGGLVARSIDAMQAHPPVADAPPDVRIRLALSSYLDVVSGIETRRWKLRLDGEVCEGMYLLVEILNIGSVGPNFAIANGAELSDGQFSVVLAGERDRDQLIEYWRARLNGETPTLSLDTRQATEVVIEHGDGLHVDDGLFPAAEGVRLWVHRGAIRVVRGPFPR